MNSEDFNPVALMFDVKERLVRIETKMDSNAEKVAKAETRLDNHEGRLDALEKAQTQQKTRTAVYASIGGLGVTLASAFGAKMLNLH